VLRENPESEPGNKQIAFKTAVKLAKHLSSGEYIPEECPPLPLWGDRLDELLQADDASFLSEVSRVFCNFDSLASSFYPMQHAQNRFRLEEQTMDIDFNRLDKLYERILKISEEETGVYEKIMEESISNITDQFSKFDSQSKLGKRYSNQLVRILAVLLSQEVLYEPQYGEIITKIADMFYNFESKPFWRRENAMELLKNLHKERFLSCFKVNQQHLTFTLMMEPDDDDTEEQEKVRNLFLIMDFFYYASRKVRLDTISLKEFHIDVINSEWKDRLKDFYIDWHNCMRGRFHNDGDIDFDLEVQGIDKRTFHKVLYIEFPWSLDAANKARLINYEGQIAKKKELHNSLDLTSILLGGLNPYLTIEVRRDSLIEDSLNSLVSSGTVLKKPLKVKFAGEPGVDEGGVQKEFFQLLVKQLFDVGYGMFEYNTESQLFWISRNSFELPLKFELMGIILGLAIYNNHILDIHLPLAFYKKLLGRRVNLDDFEQYDPQVGKSLRSILNYDKEDFEEAMCLNFTVNYESFGEKLTEDLIENGSEINVTLENKEDYIDRYIDFLMNQSVEKYFKSFKHGFDK